MLSDLQVLNNSSAGIKLSGTSATITGVTAKFNAGLGGIYSTETGTTNISYSTLDSNIAYGIFVDTNTIVNATYSNITNNKKVGVLVRTNSKDAINLSNSNIYGNGIGNMTNEDLISVKNLVIDGYRVSFRFPSYTKTIISHWQYGDIYYSSPYYYISVGNWTSAKYYDYDTNTHIDTFTNLPHSTE